MQGCIYVCFLFCFSWENLGMWGVGWGGKEQVHCQDRGGIRQCGDWALRKVSWPEQALAYCISLSISTFLLQSRVRRMAKPSEVNHDQHYSNLYLIANGYSSCCTLGRKNRVTDFHNHTCSHEVHLPTNQYCIMVTDWNNSLQTLACSGVYVVRVLCSKLRQFYSIASSKIRIRKQGSLKTSGSNEDFGLFIKPVDLPTIVYGEIMTKGLPYLNPMKIESASRNYHHC